MQILILSDIHLTDRFEEKKYNFLTKIIKEADKVILNGDFWDGYLTTFDKFINSKWNSIFPLLKFKKTIYIFGNHDRENYSDDRTNLFSDMKTHQYTYQWGKKTLIFEHGNRMLKLIDEYVPFRFLNKILTMISDSRMQQSFVKKRGIDYQHSIKLQKKINKNLRDTIYICGHVHYARDDRDNYFINLGPIRDGQASYIIISDNTIELKQETYS